MTGSGPGPGSGLGPVGAGDPRGGPPVERARRRGVSRAVGAGGAVTDPADAAAAVALARLAQRRLEARLLPSALAISGGVTLFWLVVVALPVTVSSGVHPAALAAGLGVGLLLFSAIVLLGRRQLRLARRAERRNLRLLEGR